VRAPDPLAPSHADGLDGRSAPPSLAGGETLGVGCLGSSSVAPMAGRPGYITLPIFSGLAAIGYVYYTTVFVAVARWLGLYTAAGVANAAAFTVLAAACVATYAVAVSRDPGRVPLNFVPDVEDTQSAIHEIKRKVRSRSVPLRLSRRGVLDLRGGGVRTCRKNAKCRQFGSLIWAISCGNCSVLAFFRPFETLRAGRTCFTSRLFTISSVDHSFVQRVWGSSLI
jgi:hypothetical protein